MASVLPHDAPRAVGASTPSFLRALSAIRYASSPQEALRLYKATMLRRGDPTCSYAFEAHAIVFTLKAFSTLANVPLIRHLHAHLEKTGLGANVYAGTSLLHGYVLSSAVGDACQLFDEMPERNVVTVNTMINGYCRCGDVGKARVLFDAMGESERNAATWSAMIGGYMGRGNWKQGFGLFRELLRDGQCRPNQVTMATLLSGSASLGCMALGRSIHGYCERNGIELSISLKTALVDMYAKNGCMRSAFLLFSKIKDGNVACWSAMICGFALHGYGKEALALLKEMTKEGVMPNEVTFTGVLSACCHAGLVDEAKQMFSSMTQDFGIHPSIHHYGCMVDLLGKAGMLEEAYDLVMKMRVEPNIIVWTSLLAACKMHRNFEIAFRAFDRVLKLHIPDDNGGVYVLIADIYGMAGRWNDALRIRELMRRRKARKVPGSSSMKLAEEQACELSF